MYFESTKSKTENYTVMWSIRHERVCRTISTGMIFPWDYVQFLKTYKNGLTGKVTDPELRHIWQMIYGFTYKENSKELCGWLRRAQIVIDQLGYEFSFAAFRTSITQLNADFIPKTNEPEPVLLSEFLLSQKAAMYKEDRFGTGDSFRDTNSSLLRFLKHKESCEPLEFRHITKKFLTEYENWMSKFGKASKKEGGVATAAKPDTIGIYIRNIRTVFNIAIDGAKVVSRDIYPFGEDGYRIPKSRNVKKTRTISDIEILMQHVPTTDGQAYAKDMWLFSYMCNGANMADDNAKALQI